MRTSLFLSCLFVASSCFCAEEPAAAPVKEPEVALAEKPAPTPAEKMEPEVQKTAVEKPVVNEAEAVVADLSDVAHDRRSFNEDGLAKSDVGEQEDSEADEAGEATGEEKGISAEQKSLETEEAAEVTEETKSEVPEVKVPAKPTKEVLNEVRAVIAGPCETVLILTQDIRPWLDGTPRTLREMVMEQLIINDAESLKITASEEEVDRFILQIQKNNNYTHEKVLEMLKAIDYTIEEFRNDLKRKHVVDMMLDYRVRGSKEMTVTEADVKAWWDAHSENQFKLITAHVKTKLSAEEVKEGIKNNTSKDPIEWGTPFTVTEEQLPAEKKFITEKPGGEIVSVEPEAEGFEVTKLISKGKEPLKIGNKEHDEKRYKDIERTLMMERYGTVVKGYETKLLKNAHITFKHEADRIAVMGA